MMQGFDNSTIVPLRPNKPHIVFRKGFWRVSKIQKPYRQKLHLYNKAHNFVYNLNYHSRMLIIKGLSKDEFANNLKKAFKNV